MIHILADPTPFALADYAVALVVCLLAVVLILIPGTLETDA